MGVPEALVAPAVPWILQSAEVRYHQHGWLWIIEIYKAQGHQAITYLKYHAICHPEPQDSCIMNWFGSLTMARDVASKSQRTETNCG